MLTMGLGRLINDLTDLSNIELGKVSLSLAPTSFDEVLDSVLAVMLPRAHAGGVAVSVKTPPACRPSSPITTVSPRS